MRMIAEHLQIACCKRHNPSRSEWEAETFLMSRFNTEAIRVVIPVVGELEDDDVRASLRESILACEDICRKVDHIRSTVVEAQLDGSYVRSLYLYDAVPVDPDIFVNSANIRTQ